jgi:hypothetical protein
MRYSRWPTAPIGEARAALAAAAENRRGLLVATLDKLSPERR